MEGYNSLIFDYRNLWPSKNTRDIIFQVVKIGYNYDNLQLHTRDKVKM